MSNALTGCTHFIGAEKPICIKKKYISDQVVTLSTDPTGLYAFYRIANLGEGQRRCRLHPSCSYFAITSVKKFGLLRGMLLGFARAQMEHSDQGGYLVRSVAEDGRFIYLDPLQNWKHGNHEN